jgi:hypothetical protein
VVPPDGPSCSDDALRAVGACGVAILSGTTTAGVGALVAGLGCAGALGGYIECLATAGDAANPQEKP